MKEMRKVQIDEYGSHFTGYFHKWITNQHGVTYGLVEKDDGSCGSYHIHQVRFLDSPNSIENFLPQ